MPCAHGSALALMGPSTGDDGLALPMMFYEAEPPDDICAGYARIEPPFKEVLAPTNPGALTLGRQLYWQRELDPASAFAVRVETIPPAAAAVLGLAPDRQRRRGGHVAGRPDPYLGAFGPRTIPASPTGSA